MRALALLRAAVTPRQPRHRDRPLRVFKPRYRRNAA